MQAQCGGLLEIRQANASLNVSQGQVKTLTLSALARPHSDVRRLPTGLVGNALAMPKASQSRCERPAPGELQG